jgi:DNA modification methylase
MDGIMEKILIDTSVVIDYFRKTKKEPPMNKLILGDNLEILKTLDSDSVDLIYLDPPFFSNRNYEVIWGDAGEIRSFQDRWSGGLDHYIAWLKERVVEMHRVLKPTGSLFLHCDWHANAYIRVYILDKVFGEQNFRNEIVWEKIRVKKAQSKDFPKVHDTIWSYSKSPSYTYIPQLNEITEKYKQSHYNQFDEKTGKRYQLVSLLQAGQGTAKHFGNKVLEPPAGRHWIWTQERIDKALEEGIIVFTSSGRGRPRYKRYLEESEVKGVPVGSLWNDIPPVNSQAKERIGYPTQKPEALLERIILCASNAGDIVLDPFLGGGTTVAVADRLKRQWLGIDQSVQAIKVSDLRLQKQRDLFSTPFAVQLHKYDYDTLRSSNAFEFESWIIQQYGGTANVKQRGDFGLDGKTQDGTPIQVKRSDNVGRNVIDNFFSAIQRFDKKLFENRQVEQKPVGILIAFSFGKGAIQEVARLKNQENLMIQLVTVAEIVPIATKPKLTLQFTDLGLDTKGLRELEWIAKGESEVGIEFYAWDFSYDTQEGFKADVMIDKVGKQVEKFKAGNHQVAVKVVDNEGLETLEVIQLKINGVVTV